MSFPILELKSLDQMWFQISGTICNLKCEHCFISCGPNNHTFEMMDKDYVFKIIEESANKGIKEFYFTGGEPLIHKDIIQIIKKALDYAPTTILSNGILISNELANDLNQIHQKSKYSLEIRISLDSYIELEHNKLRGKNSFKKALEGITKLVNNDFMPIVTVTKTWEDENDQIAQTNLKKILREIGYLRSRIKILPILKIGKESARGNKYGDFEEVTEEMMIDFDQSQLLCSTSRIATSKGFYSCPILIDYAQARVGETLNDSLTSIELSQKACYTCYMWGSICSNMPSAEKYVR